MSIHIQSIQFVYVRRYSKVVNRLAKAAGTKNVALNIKVRFVDYLYQISDISGERMKNLIDAIDGIAGMRRYMQII